MLFLCFIGYCYNCSILLLECDYTIPSRVAYLSAINLILENSRYHSERIKIKDMDRPLLSTPKWGRE